MGRSRKTSDQEMLIAARALFWQHGYAAVGTRQLEVETGLTRFTLQTVYKGKMALYVRVLDEYLEMLATEFLVPTAPKSLHSLADWFSRRSDPARMPNIARYGCLMMNAVIEFHGDVPEVNVRTQRYFQMIKGFLLGHLEGNVSEAGAKAEMLAAATLGLNAVIRAGGDMAAGQAVSASIVAMIEDWGRLNRPA